FDLANSAAMEWQKARDDFPLDHELWLHVDWPFQWDAANWQASDAQELPREFRDAFDAWSADLKRAIDLHEIAATEPFVNLVKKLKADIFETLASPKPATPEAMEAKPSWDTESRTLYFKGAVCKSFRRHAENQIELIEAFQEQGWPKSVPTP